MGLFFWHHLFFYVTSDVIVISIDLVILSRLSADFSLPRLASTQPPAPFTQHKKTAERKIVTIRVGKIIFLVMCYRSALRFQHVFADFPNVRMILQCRNKMSSRSDV